MTEDISIKLGMNASEANDKLDDLVHRISGVSYLGNGAEPMMLNLSMSDTLIISLPGYDKFSSVQAKILADEFSDLVSKVIFVPEGTSFVIARSEVSNA